MVVIGITFLTAGELGILAFHQLVANLVGLVFRETEQRLQGTFCEGVALLAVVRHLDNDIRYLYRLRTTVLPTLEIDISRTNPFVELLVGREADTLDFQLSGGDSPWVCDVLLFGPDLQVERAETLDMDVAPCEQLLGDLLHQGLRHQCIQSFGDDRIVGDMLDEVFLLHHLTDTAGMIRGLAAAGVRCLVHLVLYPMISPLLGHIQ